MNKIIGNIKKYLNKNIKKSIFIISLAISMILTYIVNIKIDIPQNRVYTDTDGIVSLIAIFAINYGTFSLLYIRKHLQDNKEKLKSLLLGGRIKNEKDLK